MKSRHGKSQRREEERERVRRKKIQVRDKVGKWWNTVFFHWFVAPEGRSRLAKAAGAEPSGQMRDKKLHAVVARSTFPSQNAQNTLASEYFWKLRCQKSARSCVRSTFASEKAKSTSRRTTFGRSDVVSRGRCKGLCTLSKIAQNVRVLSHVQKRWQAWDIWRRSAKMHFAWQAQYKRHVHQRC